MTPNHGQETALKRVRTCDSPFGGAGWSVLFPTVSRLAERSRSLEFTVFCLVVREAVAMLCTADDQGQCAEFRGELRRYLFHLTVIHAALRRTPARKRYEARIDDGT